ncbi:DUF4358 domain-containing protein [uncultured Oscillibacter sp.]|uniref:DUF4358 domain-containing protein n=1 Tax=uncultured Oscillibacter sp. TaxID=876091 RepID=UPI0025F5B9A2|nr:DUF4358 domain-containing protein [uncultured Oscillibacter sp.]
MKKLLFLISAALVLMMGLTACGETGDKHPDLTAYYDSMAEKLNWSDENMMETPEDVLDIYYPGLKDIETKQFIARSVMISATAEELVLMECNSPEDAEAAKDILQQRMDDQVDGGAWYPSTIETWKNAQVSVNGSYAALIVSGENQKELTEAYNALFAS